MDDRECFGGGGGGGGGGVPSFSMSPGSMSSLTGEQSWAWPGSAPLLHSPFFPWGRGQALLPTWGQQDLFCVSTTDLAGVAEDGQGPVSPQEQQAGQQHHLATSGKYQQ